MEELYLQGSTISVYAIKPLVEFINCATKLKFIDIRPRGNDLQEFKLEIDFSEQVPQIKAINRKEETLIFLAKYDKTQTTN